MITSKGRNITPKELEFRMMQNKRIKNEPHGVTVLVEFAYSSDKDGKVRKVSARSTVFQVVRKYANGKVQTQSGDVFDVVPHNDPQKATYYAVA